MYRHNERGLDVASIKIQPLHDRAALAKRLSRGYVHFAVLAEDLAGIGAQAYDRAVCSGCKFGQDVGGPWALSRSPRCLRLYTVLRPFEARACRLVVRYDGFGSDAHLKGGEL